MKIMFYININRLPAVCHAQVQVPFDRYFKVEPLLSYHRVMTMERFMVELAPTIWPAGQRIGKRLLLLCMFGAYIHF